jgi:dUTP pyrophosphatase
METSRAPNVVPTRVDVGPPTRDAALAASYAHAVTPLRVPAIRVRPLDVPLPAYRSEGAAGLDLAAAIAESIVLPAGARRLVPTGFAFAIPEGFEGQVRPRSGLALRHGVTVLNAPGTIDADFRGEVAVVLANFGDEDFVIQPGDRIAQLVVCPVARASLELVEALDATARGGGGYGSTGVAS